jgi:hypothetical protein
MCDIADTVEDGVAPDSKVAVILLTENPHKNSCGAMWVSNVGEQCG